jgi:hypothetical protein
MNLAMLTAYIDESGIHPGEHLCVVAGYCGNDAQWGGLISQWIPALGRRKNLHMRELRWKNEPRISRLLTNLGAIPERFGLVRIVGGIWHKDHREIVDGIVSNKYSSPYMLAAQACMSYALKSVPPDEEIAFVFDRQHLYEPVVQDLNGAVFDMMKTDKRLKEITFTDKAATVCLDPADYLAFQIREYKSYPQSRKAALGMSILGDGRAIGEIYSRERVQSYADYMVSHGAVPGGRARITYEMYLKLKVNKYVSGGHRFNLL